MRQGWTLTDLDNQKPILISTKIKAASSIKKEIVSISLQLQWIQIISKIINSIDKNLFLIYMIVNRNRLSIFAKKKSTKTLMIFRKK